MADAPLAPVNNAYKFFIANIDFQTTAPQVKQFFSAFGSVNHVKLIPHTSSSGYNDDSDGGRQRHKGYGFLFMLDEPSTLAVERYANAFPDNKIEMLGRRGVFVKRQVGMGREGGGFQNSNVGRANHTININSENATNYQQSWGKYLHYDAQQSQYNTAVSAASDSGYGLEHTGQYSQVNGITTTYPQQSQPQAVMAPSSQVVTDYYTLQTTYLQQQQQPVLEFVQAPQHLQYTNTSTTQPSAASVPNQYAQQQYPNISVYPEAYPANYAVSHQSSSGQQVVQQQTLYTNHALVYGNQRELQHQQPQHQLHIVLQSQPSLATSKTLEYSQNSHQPPMQMSQQIGPAIPPPPPPPPQSQHIQMNRWDQWQQERQQQAQVQVQTFYRDSRSMQPPNPSLRGAGGGGGKWNGGGVAGGERGGRGNIAGGSGTATAGHGRNDREGRRDRPY